MLSTMPASESEPPRWIVAGLGNPGERYAGTRHDVGFMAVDRMASRRSWAWRSDGACAVACEQPPGGLVAALARRFGLRPNASPPLVLAKPLLYMNRSGAPLARLLEQHGVRPERLLVVTDDVNLPLGRIRLRASGSSGGHNGLASIIEALGDGFPRLRVGVGAAPKGTDLAEWVLSRFAEDELSDVDDAVARAVAVVDDVVDNGVDAAMPRVAQRPGGERT